MDARKGIELLLTPGVAPSDWERLEVAFREAERVDDVDVASALGRLDLTPAPRVEIRKQCEAMLRAGARLVFRWEADYPPALRAAAMAPHALFVRGLLPAGGEPAVAIVGTRKPSGPGSAFARELARTLSLLGVTIVSGMARGIDTAAHEGALAAQGLTIAVLGTGVDVVYPPENGALMDRILATGGIVSEQVCGMQAFPQVFPRRNRIVSGLCDAVVVVEGGARSGALITAKWALDQGREVGAVPGFPGSFRSEGPNQLLKEGAFLVRDAIDVVTNVQRVGERVRVHALAGGREDEPGAGLDGDAARVFDLLSHASSIDEVAAAAGISVEKAQSVLTILEVDGRIRRDDAGNYARISFPGRR
jgi:DNA processing protein